MGLSAIQLSTAEPQIKAKPLDIDVEATPKRAENPRPEKRGITKSLQNQKNQTSGYKVALIEATKILSDAALRALGRSLEPSGPNLEIKDRLIRGVIRGPWEAGRKLFEVISSNFLYGKEELITKDQTKVALTRAFEHVPATIIIEPNSSEGIGRLGAGLANVLLRIGTRFGSHKAGIIDWKSFLSVGPEKEIAVKTLGRAGGLLFRDNPFISRMFEQTLINTGVNHKLWNCIEGKTKPEDQEATFITAA